MKKIIKDNWILIIVVAQPLLDVLAFWTASESGTIAGYIRLVLMAVLVIASLLKSRDKKIWFAMIAFGSVFAFHFINGFRVGYKDFFSDINYAAKVGFMPAMAVALSCFIDDERLSKQVFKGIIINAFLTAIIIILSYITGTFTDTYGPGWGISGWVISDNRCCHSDILSSCCVFLGYLAVKSKKRVINVGIPILIFALLLTNGTQACFYTLFGIMIFYPVFLVARHFITKEKMNALVSSVMVILAIITVIIYPYTPRCKMETYERSFFSDVQIKFVQKMNDMGYDIVNMTPNERMEDETVHAELIKYYLPFLYSGMPDRTVEAFDIDRIIWKYNVSIEAGKIGDNRDMKEVFASLMFEDCDFLTRCFGYEFATIGEDLTADLENDWYSIFYYYGYYGFSIYVLACIYILYRIIVLVVHKFKTSITDENFCLLMCFVLQLGLAYFSGAILRRPNASIYLSLVVGCIVFATRKGKNDEA